MSIPDSLKELVFQSVKCLGQVIKEDEGEKIFHEVEKLRKSFKKTRYQSDEYLKKKLESESVKLKKLNSEELYIIAKSFTLMLELINACEISFRAFLNRKKIDTAVSIKNQQLIYVFTGHPTEARNKAFLQIMTKIGDLLEKSQGTNFKAIENELKYYLKLALRIEVAKHRKPKVKDEAIQIYYFILNEKILEKQIELKQQGLDVGFRTWVGGDKDGHPGVGGKELKESLQLSRISLVQFVEKQIKNTIKDLVLVSEKKLLEKIREIEILLKKSKVLSNNDGNHIVLLRKKFKRFFDEFQKKFGESYILKKVEIIFWLYPALVVPLELREDSEILKNLTSPKAKKIKEMLKIIKSISNGYDAKWYARGLIVSMCETDEDLYAGHRVLKLTLGNNTIPVVPLFENEKGLVNSVNVLKKIISQEKIVELHKKRWNSKYEIMIGYSDSSKENGVLASRVLLKESIDKIESLLNKMKLIPVFFHGSGGSISRGGGSIQEQISWLPKSSLHVFKMTVQGESIQRNFGNKDIVQSQVDKIKYAFRNYENNSNLNSSLLKKFTNQVQASYKVLVNNQSFHKLVFETTPYQFLNQLKLGSRPTKRNKAGEFSLRAIPWVLCWTQTRLFMPVWWGIGSAWSELTQLEKKQLKNEFNDSPLLSSFIKNLGFTLAKIEFGIWNYNLEKSNLSKIEKEYWLEKFSNELNLVKKFFLEIKGNNDYTWYRSWLGESVVFRSSMIHPLNLIQSESLIRKDDYLLRLTVTGIACGMLTTG